jgi:GNAT superfamily N-acetyltransferase
MHIVEAIRDADSDEVADLEALQLRASTVYESDRDHVLAHPEAVELPADAAPHGRVRVAVGEGRVLGFTVVLPVHRGSCELDGLFVEPDLWRRGIGAVLVADALHRARSAGALRMEVIANPNALGFYQKVGFTVTGDVATRFGSGLRMCHDLARP